MGGGLESAGDEGEKKMEQTMKWIPPTGWITDRQPEENGYYLTTVKEENGTLDVDINQFWDGHWPDVELLRNKVIAWTTLPEPEEER